MGKALKEYWCDRCLKTQLRSREIYQHYKSIPGWWDKNWMLFCNCNNNIKEYKKDVDDAYTMISKRKDW